MKRNLHPNRAITAAFLAGMLAVGTAACSNSTDSNSSSNETTTTLHDMGDMGDTGAAPLEGGETLTGQFELLDTRTDGHDDVAGTATLERNEDTTRVTVELDGLIAGYMYMSHVHVGSCADGGGHYQFEIGGEEAPPNEIHLMFTPDAEGHTTTVVVADQRVDDTARSIVVHPMVAMDNQIACADLS